MSTTAQLPNLPKLSPSWSSPETVNYYNEIIAEKVVDPTTGCWQILSTDECGAFYTREFVWQFTFGRPIGTDWLSAKCANAHCMNPLHAQLNAD